MKADYCPSEEERERYNKLPSAFKLMVSEYYNRTDKTLGESIDRVATIASDIFNRAFDDGHEGSMEELGYRKRLKQEDKCPTHGTSETST